MMQSTQGLSHRVKKFYERVSVEREAALADLPTLYSEQVHFINPVVDAHGLVAFRAAWDTALRRYKVFQFHDIAVIGTDEQFSLNCSMTIAFGVGPSFSVEMAALCRAKDGKVVFLRDYFDPLGSLVAPLGPARWVYRKAFGLMVA
jgi:hypothetical protein